MQKETSLQNWAQVGKLAHKLKSTIDSMGISSLKDTIRQIEQSGKKRRAYRANAGAGGSGSVYHAILCSAGKKRFLFIKPNRITPV